MQLAGELSKISLPNLIQLLRDGQLTGKVCLTQGANTAFIYVLDGRIIHAETDSDQGRSALLDLFLWLNGTYSLVEADTRAVTPTLSPDEPIEKVIREGLAYLEKKKHLDQLRVGSRTILKPIAAGKVDNPVYERLDGQITLGQAAAGLNLRRVEYINWVYELISKGQVSVIEPPANPDSVELPAWVVSRLKQDNPDISQAIVQMVIWVDRVKCWMYQADADLEQVIMGLEGKTPERSAPADEKDISPSGQSR